MFTPKGKIMALPRGATAVDFAYAVHTDIGHHCTAARINYELMPLRTELKNGDQVEIMTSPTARPNPSWLNFVATGKARSRIRHFLKSLQQRESAALGERMLEQALASLKVPPESITWERWEALAREYGAKGRLEILADIGVGKRLSFVVAQALTRASARAGGRATPHPAKAGHAAATRRRGRRHSVREVLPADSRRRDRRPVSARSGSAGAHPRLPDAEKEPGRQRSDRRRRMGARRSKVCSKPASACSSPTSAVCSPSSRPKSPTPAPTSTTCRWSVPTAGTVVTMFFTVQVRDREHLADVMRALHRIPEVKRVQRART